MVPDWLHVLAIFSLVIAGLCALVIAADEVRHPQKMGIMNVVWPINALYFGPVGLWAYFAIGRKSTKEHMEQQEHSGEEQAKDEPKDPVKKAEKKGMKPFWQIVSVGVTHYGAGCTLGDIIAE